MLWASFSFFLNLGASNLNTGSSTTVVLPVFPSLNFQRHIVYEEQDQLLQKSY